MSKLTTSVEKCCSAVSQVAQLSTERIKDVNEMKRNVEKLMQMAYEEKDSEEEEDEEKKMSTKSIPKETNNTTEKNTVQKNKGESKSEEVNTIKEFAKEMKDN